MADVGSRWAKLRNSCRFGRLDDKAYRRLGAWLLLLSILWGAGHDVFQSGDFGRRPPSISMTGHKALEVSSPVSSFALPTTAPGRWAAAWTQPSSPLMDNGSEDADATQPNASPLSGLESHWPDWMRLLPPLVAIVLAFLLREVVLALTAGIWTALLLQHGLSLRGLLQSLGALVDTVLIDALTDAAHQSVILFSLLIGGMVGMLQANGGLQGIVERLQPLARNARRSQLVTWLLGMIIFFDDYANTLIVGHTMRPLTDRYGVSRARLAYIVDSTSAPLAAIAFVTTWVGAEVGYIDQALQQTAFEVSAYGAFLQSLQYAYYPVFALALVGITIGMRRDWPAMRAAPAHRANKDTEAPASANIRPRMRHALAPILSLIVISAGGLIYTGVEAAPDTSASDGGLLRLADILGAADAYRALLWGSLAAVLVAWIFSATSARMRLSTISEAMLKGFRQMMDPLVILVLAWGLSAQTQILDTGGYLAGLFPDGVSPAWIPALLFVLAGLVAFSTGSSWGTMALMYPLFLNTSVDLALQAGWTSVEAQELFFQSASVILAGAVFGDHCSPISDTTILSSLAAGCDHLEHVRTQLPYAMLCAVVALLCGTIPAAFFPSWWILGYGLGLMLLFAIVRYTAQRVDM